MQLAKEIIDFHKQLIDKNGVANATGFSLASKLKRYDVIIEELAIKQGSLLDYGCNVGDFCDYVIQRTSLREYFGVDICPEFIEKAKQRYPFVYFICSDAFNLKIKPIDYVVASGVFCYKYDRAKEINTTIMKILWGLTKRTMIFNVLNADYPQSNHDMLLYDVRELAIVAKELNCKNFGIRTGYLPNDITITLRR